MAFQAFILKPVLRAALSLMLFIGPACSIHTALAGERVWRLGWLDLNPAPPDASAVMALDTFREGMRELGYAENRDFVIEARFADTDRERLPRLAKELVDSRVDLILTVGTPTTRAAKEATGSIPIVMTGSRNPVELGLVASFSHPGANVTGLTYYPGPGFVEKGVQLLQAIVPQMSRLAVLRVYPTGVGRLVEVDPILVGITQLTYDLVDVRDTDQLANMFNHILADRADALLVHPEFVIEKYAEEIGKFITSNRLPTLTQTKPLISKGALLYYYTDQLKLRRQAATFVHKIIKGAKPSDLPVEQPSKFEFIVNLQTARALGLSVPSAITAFADQLIE
jgi:putative ABC transport system substrate-binding protein